MENFDTATALTPQPDGSFHWGVPPGWAVTRGSWGGLVVGALLNAITASEDDSGRLVRSVSAELAGPAMPGDHTITAARHRRGSGLSTWGATVVNGEGELVARLTAVLAEARPSADDANYESWGMSARPDAPPAADVPELGDFPLELLQRLDLRPVSGLPYSSEPAMVLGWVRLREPVPHTAASLLALVDGWWAATIASLDRFRPIATVNFSANLLVDPAAIAPGEFLLHHGFATGAHAGFTSEQRRLWTADGRLVVDNLQSVALIK